MKRRPKLRKLSVCLPSLCLFEDESIVNVSITLTVFEKEEENRK